MTRRPCLLLVEKASTAQKAISTRDEERAKKRRLAAHFFHAICHLKLPVKMDGVLPLCRVQSIWSFLA